MPSRTLLQRLESADHVVVLTGAGASAESGIPTFRDPDGLWASADPIKLASVQGFLEDPVGVQSWYSARARGILSAQPHAGHFALARLEELVPRFTLVTQNVDGLHTRAGSQNTIEIHGDLLRYHCISCGEAWERLDVDADAAEPVRCSCGGLIRPSVIWFGELLDQDLIGRAQSAALDCDVFLAVGTGAEVHPAASLPRMAADRGAYLAEVNPNETGISALVDESIRGTAGTILPALVEHLEQTFEVN